MSMHQPPGNRPGPIGILARIGGLIVVATIAGLLFAFMLVPFVGGAGVLTRDVVKNFESLPDSLSTPPLPQRSLILASDGSVLANLYYQNRVEVPIDSISPYMRQATVAIEDSRFLDHNGVDFRGVVRSIATNVESGAIEQGSSTLTMQYVKNVLVNQAATADELDAARGDSATRKLREVRYALGLEKIFTKAEILERYLNIAYFGAGSYGVEAAARRYFSKPAADLDLGEAATLAGIVQQPTAYDPLRNPELSTTRRNVVLKRMAELGYVSQDEADRAALIPMERAAATLADHQRLHLLVRALLLRLRRPDDPQGPDVRRHPRGARGVPPSRRLHDPHDSRPEGAERGLRDGHHVHPRQGRQQARHRDHAWCSPAPATSSP